MKLSLNLCKLRAANQTSYTNLLTSRSSKQLLMQEECLAKKFFSAPQTVISAPSTSAIDINVSLLLETSSDVADYVDAFLNIKQSIERQMRRTRLLTERVEACSRQMTQLESSMETLINMNNECYLSFSAQGKSPSSCELRLRPFLSRCARSFVQ